MEVQVWVMGEKIETSKLSGLKQKCLDIARDAGRICYSKFDLEEIRKEENKEKLINILVGSGHHSPFDHPFISLYLKDIPKICAMILNNEKVYVTSEKSARYTKMELEGVEKEIYDKWMDIFKDRIKEQYPNLDDLKITKLSMENARYFTSVFTPTKMQYTISFRQLNYMMSWFEEYIENYEDNDFTAKIKQFMTSFNEQLSDLRVKEISPNVKKRSLSLFSDRNDIPEEFGENYSVTYKISFACLAQAHRHRSLNYEITHVDNLFKLDSLEYYVPPLVEDLKEEWSEDMKKVKEHYPQAILIDVHEFGNHKDFLSKIHERVCGHAQLEIMNNSIDLIKKYVEAVKGKNDYIYSLLSPTMDKAKCKFPGGKCLGACPFGPDGAILRKI